MNVVSFSLESINNSNVSCFAVISGSVCGPILLQLHYDVFSLFLVKRKH